jgi:hypothetical protein
MQGANGTHQIQYGANASSPTFSFYDAAAATTRMTIDASGNTTFNGIVTGTDFRTTYVYKYGFSGLKFESNALISLNSNNSTSGGTVDLGTASQKWKDMYLSGSVKALRVIQDGAPVIDAKGLISTLSTLRKATMDETQDIRESLRSAIDELISGFEQEIATKGA